MGNAARVFAAEKRNNVEKGRKEGVRTAGYRRPNRLSKAVLEEYARCSSPETRGGEKEGEIKKRRDANTEEEK